MFYGEIGAVNMHVLACHLLSIFNLAPGSSCSKSSLTSVTTGYKVVTHHDYSRPSFITWISPAMRWDIFTLVSPYLT